MPMRFDSDDVERRIVDNNFKVSGYDVDLPSFNSHFVKRIADKLPDIDDYRPEEGENQVIGHFMSKGDVIPITGELQPCLAMLFPAGTPVPDKVGIVEGVTVATGEPFLLVLKLDRVGNPVFILRGASDRFRLLSTSGYATDVVEYTPDSSYPLDPKEIRKYFAEIYKYARPDDLINLFNLRSDNFSSKEDLRRLCVDVLQSNSSQSYLTDDLFAIPQLFYFDLINQILKRHPSKEQKQALLQTISSPLNFLVSRQKTQHDVLKQIFTDDDIAVHGPFGYKDFTEANSVELFQQNSSIPKLINHFIALTPQAPVEQLIISRLQEIDENRIDLELKEVLLRALKSKITEYTCRYHAQYSAYMGDYDGRHVDIFVAKASAATAQYIEKLGFELENTLLPEIASEYINRKLVVQNLARLRLRYTTTDAPLKVKAISVCMDKIMNSSAIGADEMYRHLEELSLDTDFTRNRGLRGFLLNSYHGFTTGAKSEGKFFYQVKNVTGVAEVKALMAKVKSPSLKNSPKFPA